MRNWPPGSTTRQLRDLREDDEVLVELMFRVVKWCETTDEGFVVHFKDGDFPPRLYPDGPDTVVRVWNTIEYGPGVPQQMSIY